jgi:hypothetical protein
MKSWKVLEIMGFERLIEISIVQYDVAARHNLFGAEADPKSSCLQS